MQSRPIAFTPPNQQLKLPFSSREELFNERTGKPILFTIDPHCRSNAMFYMNNHAYSLVKTGEYEGHIEFQALCNMPKFIRVLNDEEK